MSFHSIKSFKPELSYRFKDLFYLSNQVNH